MTHAPNVFYISFYLRVFSPAVLLNDTCNCVYDLVKVSKVKSGEAVILLSKMFGVSIIQTDARYRRIIHNCIYI